MKQLGFLYDALGDQSEAISYWLMACDLDSQDVFMLNRLGRVALNMGYFHVGGYAFNEVPLFLYHYRHRNTKYDSFVLQ